MCVHLGVGQLRGGVGFLRDAARSRQFSALRDEQHRFFPAANGDFGGALHPHGNAHHPQTGARRIAPHQQVAEVHSQNVR
jgi:hypothetical protein